MRMIAVGSENPAKLMASAQAFTEAYDPHHHVIGKTVPSDVPDMPMTMEDTLRGSVNRARAVFDVVERTALAPVDFGVGLEGGMTRTGDDWYCVEWATVIARDGKISSAPTPGVRVPPAVAENVLGGMELGGAVDLAFGRNGCRRAGGLVEIVTGGRITRLAWYVTALVTALGSMHCDPDGASPASRARRFNTQLVRSVASKGEDHG